MKHYEPLSSMIQNLNLTNSYHYQYHYYIISLIYYITDIFIKHRDRYTSMPVRLAAGRASTLPCRADADGQPDVSAASTRPPAGRSRRVCASRPSSPETPRRAAGIPCRPSPCRLRPMRYRTS